MAERKTTPLPGSPEYERAVEVARKIEKMARDPVDNLARAMRLMGFGPDHRRIVLEEMARHALREASK